jgi:hypothetical protein
MTLQMLHSEFPYIWGKFDFLFYQCAWQRIITEYSVGPFKSEADICFGICMLINPWQQRMSITQLFSYSV